MANCNQCSRDVGCACNLIDGSCPSCYSKSLGQDGIVQKKSTSRVIYKKDPTNVPPNTEFEIILKTPGLSKEEKLKRINAILEKAINNV